MLHGLGSDWLHQYPVAIDPLSTKPSRGHSRPKAKPELIPVGGPSTHTNPSSSSSPAPLSDSDTGTSLDDDSEGDDDSDYLVEETIDDFELDD